MGILDSQGPKSRCDPGTSNWALIWFKSWEGGDISHKLVTIFPSSRYPPKIQRGGELITRKNTLVICYIFELTFIEAWKMFLEKSTKHPFSPLLTSMTLMESKYWNSEQKCTAQMKEEKQVLQLDIYRFVHQTRLNRCFQTVCQYMEQIWTTSREMARTFGHETFSHKACWHQGFVNHQLLYFIVPH